MEQYNPIKIAVFGSGMGSNAKKIIEHFNLDTDNSKIAIVSIIVCNNINAGIVEMAKFFEIPVLIVNKKELNSAEIIQQIKASADFIVLAGFLLQIPVSLIQPFVGRIINIHPALLPLYGGKGMYGSKVHEAVLKNGDKQSGISIHYVDENYDTGEIIFQAKCEIDTNETLLSLAKKIHNLEHQKFPAVIKQEVLKLKASLNS